MSIGPTRVPTLGPLERDVLEALWQLSAATNPRPEREHSARGVEVSIREVHEYLADHNLAYTTVSTVLTNLEKKGILTVTKSGRRILYSPVLSRDEYSAALMNEALAYSQDRRASILHFISAMDSAEISMFRCLIESIGGRRHPNSPATPASAPPPDARPEGSPD